MTEHEHDWRLAAGDTEARYYDCAVPGCGEELTVPKSDLAPEPCAEEVDTLHGNVWGFRPCGETKRDKDGRCICHPAHRTTTADRIVRLTLPHVIRELESAVKYAADAEPNATGYYDRPAVLARILADLREVRQ